VSTGHPVHSARTAHRRPAHNDAGTENAHVRGMRLRLPLLGLVVAALLAGTAQVTGFSPCPAETAVRAIPLTGAAADADAELSGLAWRGDDLLLLPQYPRRVSADTPDGALLAIARPALEAYLDGRGPAPTPRPVELHAHGLADRIEGWDGFEAIAVDGDTVYLSVEATLEGPHPSSHGYVVRGRFVDEAIVLDDAEPVRIDAQADVPNMAYESLAVIGDEVYAFYEANGQVNAEPHAVVFDADLSHRRVVPLDAIEFRITDLTAPDADGHLWATNYMWEGASWQAGACPIAARFGLGETHRTSRTVERLVELEVDADGVHPTRRAPIQLELGPQARNWEGIVRLGDRGFLIVTDKFPESILGFVATDG